MITSAVAPDANIIFGATLKPEMEDELIITVIATGFDSQYFHEQAAAFDEQSDEEVETETESVLDDEAVDAAVENMTLTDQDEDAPNAAHFTADDDDPTHIWRTADEDEADTPAFLRRKKKQ